MVTIEIIKVPIFSETSGPDTHGQSEKETGLTNTIVAFWR